MFCLKVYTFTKLFFSYNNCFQKGTGEGTLREPVDMQKTLRGKVSIKGFGLHTGKSSRITIEPADVDTGITFVKDGIEIPASYDNVVDVNHATNLGKDNVMIRTVEHLLSALYGLGVDNARIYVEGEEIPGLDGSSKIFAEEILKVGIKEQEKRRAYYKVLRAFKVEREDGGFIEVHPNGGGFRAVCTISYDHPFLKHQAMCFDDFCSYCEEVAPARTYCFYEEIAHLLRMGLGRGGNIRNALVVGKEGFLNGPPRFEDEPVRHKLLDLLGDLKLLGLPIMGEIRAFKAGHSLHLKFIKLFAQSDAFEIEGGH